MQEKASYSRSKLLQTDSRMESVEQINKFLSAINKINKNEKI